MRVTSSGPRFKLGSVLQSLSLPSDSPIILASGKTCKQINKFSGTTRHIVSSKTRNSFLELKENLQGLGFESCYFSAV